MTKKKRLPRSVHLKTWKKCLILQTRSRVEIYVISENEKDTANLVKDYFVRRAAANADEVSKATETSLDSDAFIMSHELLRV
jgi:glutamyl-tRNA reductase